MKNVLMISIDDLFNYNAFRTKFGVTIQTPNFDRLAEMGTFFDNAYATTPQCNPSRATIMTGKSVFETQVFNNSEEFYAFIDPAETMPAAFKNAGYTTSMLGKVFHPPVPLGREFVQGILDTQVTSFGLRNQNFNFPFWNGPLPPPNRDDDYYDYDTVTKAIALLEAYDARGAGAAPFMMSIGIYRPHAPTIVPQAYFDLYPIEDIVAAGFTEAEIDALPAFAKEFARGSPEAPLAARVQGYLASVTFADAQLGRLLDVLDANDQWDDTTIALWSDHGYNLGDHDHFGKFTLWEQAANAPVILIDPDQDQAGRVETTPIGLNQIFATLTELAGIATPSTVSAPSFAGLIDASLGRYDAKPVFTFIYGSISMRDGAYRLIRYEDGGLELYDLSTDPDQRLNLALDPANRPLLQSMIARLREAGAEEGIRFGDNRAVLNGGNQDDRLIAGNNVDSVVARDGDDMIFILPQTQVIEDVNAGIDTVVLRSDLVQTGWRYTAPDNVENVTVGVGMEGIRLQGNALDNQLVTALRTSATVQGMAGDDRIFGSLNADTIFGGTGDDVVEAFRGDDRVFGDAGNDRMQGWMGNDALFGGEGNDILIGFAGDDRLDGGAGIDRASYVDGTSPVHADLMGLVPSLGHARGDRYIDIEGLVGSDFNDRLLGDSGANTLIGQPGNDQLFGRAGNDLLVGGGGNDWLNAQTGADFLVGGAGRDIFVFTHVAHSSGTLFDTVFDFQQGQDRIDLRRIDANGAEAGSPGFAFLGDAVFSGDGGELIRKTTAGGNTVLWGDVDGDRLQDFGLVLLGDIAATGADFLL
ncbi:MAG: sulfatase-like hydrolase/transferase [Pseudomonadota bacterium]